MQIPLMSLLCAWAIFYLVKLCFVLASFGISIYYRKKWFGHENFLKQVFGPNCNNPYIMCGQADPPIGPLAFSRAWNLKQGL